MNTQAYLKTSKKIQMSGSSLIQTIIVFWMNLVKRSFDIIMSLIGLLFLTPIFLYIAALIKRDSPGPVFYWGPRMGRNRKPFKILKFRTMYEDLNSYMGPSVTALGDDRITPLGHWLRDTKINELPQLWNVLIGEMSLVGPRPEDVKIAETWPADSAQEILSVRPGITSPASILYHDEEKILSGTNLMGNYFKNILPDKMRLDRLYIRYHSFFSDIDVIFWTLAILVPRIAKTRIPEGYIFAGPFSVLVRRYVHWFTLDLATALIAVTITSVLWSISVPVNWETSHLVMLGILQAFLFSGINSILGGNKVVWPKARSEDAIGPVLSCGFATATILILDYLRARYNWLPYPPLPPMMMLTVGLLAGVGFLAVRYRLRLIAIIANSWLSWRKDDGIVGERVIIAGSGEGTQIASWLLRRRMFRTAFSLVGAVDHMDPTAYGMKIDGLWMLGSINDLPALVKKHDIGVILSTLPPNSLEVKYLIALKKVSPIRIIFLNDLMGIVDQQMTKPVGTTDFPLWLDERLEFTALQDSLTELPSWTLFQDRLQHSLALAKRNNTHTQPGFVFVELNGLLHLAPDKLSRNSLFKDVAHRLNRIKRETDTLSRLNDNMLVLLLENMPDKPQLDLITKRIYDAMSKPFEIIGQEIKIEPNIYVSSTDTYEEGETTENVNIAGLSLTQARKPEFAM
jgi:lipopolysaccharide/colanic/teichoic acid biosynthesis glycosyltransferase/GGDEF domain-containing protein